jgi:transcription elongation factor Elf1
MSLESQPSNGRRCHPCKVWDETTPAVAEVTITCGCGVEIYPICATDLEALHKTPTCSSCGQPLELTEVPIDA